MHCREGVVGGAVIRLKRESPSERRRSLSAVPAPVPTRGGGVADRHVHLGLLGSELRAARGGGTSPGHVAVLAHSRQVCLPGGVMARRLY